MAQIQNFGFEPLFQDFHEFFERIERMVHEQEFLPATTRVWVKSTRITHGNK